MSKDHSHDNEHHVPRERLIRRYRGHISLSGFLAAFLFIVAVVFSTFKPFQQSEESLNAAARMSCDQVSVQYGIAQREKRSGEAQRLWNVWMRDCRAK